MNHHGKTLLLAIKNWSLIFLLLMLGLRVCFADSNIAPAQKRQDQHQVSQSENSSLSQTKAESDIPSDEMELDNLSQQDPLERINRVIFTFNDTVDIYLMKPVAKLYNAIVPKPLNKGIHNFFNNLDEVTVIINDALQFNFYQMVKDTTRLVINSTFGIGGLFDIAAQMNIPRFQNDFGLTLASWGYRNSSYLVVPFLGPYTIRDGIGLGVDYFAFSVYPYIEPDSRRYQVLGLYFVDHRANLLQLEPILEEAAVDKYVFMRNAYFQHRIYQVERLKRVGYKDREHDQPILSSS
jgi:phospholipid-binding lipoprotein MlaA